MYCNGYSENWYTRIVHMSTGKEVFEVKNALWGTVIQDSKCGYFDNLLKCSSKTVLQQ
jgi:hypothetical protein